MNPTVAILFARGGSKGVPKKNLRLLGGKPLVAWSIEHALKCPSIDDVIVSTDCSEIAKVAESYGAKVPFLRPKELAQDDSPEWLAWQHAIDYYEKENKIGIFVTIPTTSPLRNIEDVEACIKKFKNSDADIVITATKTTRSPWFNMVRKDEMNKVKRVIEPTQNIFRRQDAPEIYDMTTVAYVASPSFIMSHDSIFSGNVAMIEIPHERSLDIDTEFDFKMAELYLKEFNYEKNF